MVTSIEDSTVNENWRMMVYSEVLGADDFYLEL